MLKTLQTYTAVSGAIVAAITIVGFVVHFRLSHLFGVELPVVWQGYLEYGGDCFLSVPVAVYDAWRPLSNICRGITLGEGVLLFVAGAALVAAAMYGGCARRWSRAAIALRRVAAITVSLAACALLTQAVALLRFEHVLQPWVAADARAIHELQMSVATDDVGPQAAGTVVMQIFEKQTPSMIKSYGADWEQYFRPGKRVDSEAARRRAYSRRALAFVLVFGAVLLCSVKGVFSSTSASAVAFALLLFALPITYATVGRNFIFPLVSLNINQPPHRTHALYLLSRTTEELVLYDRAGGFRLRRLPARVVDRVDTLGVASPFSTCVAQGGGRPCESLWAPDDKLRDF